MLKSLTLTAAFIAVAICHTSVGAVETISRVDLTPVFKGMEKDCGNANPKFQAALGWLATHSGNPPVLAKAGAELRAAIGTGRIKVKDDGDFWTLTVPITSASYRGIAVTGVERWLGKDNGISGISLTFATPLAAVSKSIIPTKPAKGNADNDEGQNKTEKIDDQHSQLEV
jgi:hypothetical protein